MILHIICIALGAQEQTDELAAKEDESIMPENEEVKSDAEKGEDDEKSSEPMEFADEINLDIDEDGIEPESAQKVNLSGILSYFVFKKMARVETERRRSQTF